MNGRNEGVGNFTEYSEYLHLQESMKSHNEEINKYVYIIHYSIVRCRNRGKYSGHYTHEHVREIRNPWDILIVTLEG